MVGGIAGAFSGSGAAWVAAGASDALAASGGTSGIRLRHDMRPGGRVLVVVVAAIDDVVSHVAGRR